MEKEHHNSFEKLGYKGNERHGAVSRSGARKRLCIFIIISACFMMVESCLNAKGKEPAKEERLKAREGIIY